MDFLGDKMNSIAGGALSGARRRWNNRANDSSNREATEANAIQMHLNRNNLQSTPLSAGIPFGGDSHSWRRSPFPPPPPIGFRTDLLQAGTGAPCAQPPPVVSSSPQSQPSPPSAGPISSPAERLDASSESLYQGDAWSRLWFQRVMILCLLRLLLFIRKVYEDFQATKVYNLTGQHGHFLIAATTLFLPTIVFTIYRVSRYLQLTLPSLRAAKQLQQAPKKGPAPGGEHATSSNSTSMAAQKSRTDNQDDDDAQLRRALMSSPDRSPGMATPVDEGLVTARQTPTNMDEFHDSKSRHGSTTEIESETAGAPPRPPPRRSNGDAPAVSVQERPVKLESINVDKMNDIPDRETMRVFSGACEQLLHGALFIFWQLKRQVDVMGYLVERACLWRKPAEREKDELNRLNCHRDGLEWFQDFYAAFLAILTQVYTLGLHWSATGDEDSTKRLSSSQLNAATSSLGSSEAAGGGGDNSISQSARAVSTLLSMQAIAGNTLNGKDVLLMSELIVSSAVVVSLLICVRRRDDGPLTLGLSMIGWGSLFAARIIIIALAFVHIGWAIMLPLVVAHVICITAWIYSIALDSHNGRASELGDEAKWDEEAGAAIEPEQPNPDSVELKAAPTSGGADGQQRESQPPTSVSKVASVTSGWSFMEHLVLLSQILSLFAIPSLFYWPIMFNLKLHLRPFKYLVLILMQNFLLITAIWFTISASGSATPGQLYLLGAVGAFSIVGFLFVSFYVLCKPSLTEYFARADELFNEADKAGIYFEFCSRVFRMPDLSKGAFRRLMDQTEAMVEVVVNDVDDDEHGDHNRQRRHDDN
jgi:hypothetical protein